MPVPVQDCNGPFPTAFESGRPEGQDSHQAIFESDLVDDGQAAMQDDSSVVVTGFSQQLRGDPEEALQNARHGGEVVAILGSDSDGSQFLLGGRSPDHRKRHYGRSDWRSARISVSDRPPPALLRRSSSSSETGGFVFR